MSNRVKAGLCLALFVVLQGLYFYLTWDARVELSRKWIALGPINWIDFGAGAFVMFLVLMMAFVWMSLREADRFERDLGGDDGGSSGSSGGGKRVRLPMSRKVIDINTWEPPKGQYHRGITASA